MPANSTSYVPVSGLLRWGQVYVSRQQKESEKRERNKEMIVQLIKKISSNATGIIRTT